MSTENKHGKILLVGVGPGAREHMSLRALEAMQEADVIIGYSTYIKLVKDLLVGKEIIRKGMTEEIDRCIEAYDQAKMGKTVALISSGDIGVYGMAGPTFEVLLQEGWMPDHDIKVEIIPGTTALSACASLVGAPLTHDFCSISLSDLLTPWPTIAKRLNAVGASDFVIALYNPKSSRRYGQIEQAQEILLRYRKPDTPVAIVKSAYRRRQDIQMVRLDEMSGYEIGMLTTVLIGNSSTFTQDGLMITRRGYANKYDGITGDALEGEKKGRSLSMGLTEWHGVVREYMRNGKFHTLRKVAEHFNAPLGQILQAITAASDDDKAGDFEALAIEGDTFSIIEAAKQWGLLRAVVRSEAGAISELKTHAKDLVQKNDWLNIENDHFHLHINWSSVTKVTLVRRDDSYRSAFFTDIHGHSVFNISLVRTDKQFDDAAFKAFEVNWQSHQSAAKQLETSDQ
ncbi:MAG: precorrin-3B C(17)-methyltransferase [bacterium]|nr:precorrin-3B C(17)-methyltransferase [bacterium]